MLGIPGETEEDVDEMIRTLVTCKLYVHSVEFINTLVLAGGGEYLREPDGTKSGHLRRLFRLPAQPLLLALFQENEPLALHVDSL